MNRRAYKKYIGYQRWWEIVERNLIIIAVLLFLMLYASQLLNFIVTQKGGSLLIAQIEQLEGKAITSSQSELNTGTVELTVISNSKYQNLKIYINGDYLTSFYKKTISLTVKNNDIIEISGINNEYPCKIKISSISDNILDMEAADIINVNKSFAAVGRVRLK